MVYSVESLAQVKEDPKYIDTKIKSLSQLKPKIGQKQFSGFRAPRPEIADFQFAIVLFELA